MKGLRTLVLGAAMVIAGSAFAQTTPVRTGPALSAALKRISVETFAVLLQDQGYKAEVVRTGEKPYILTGLNGRRVTVGFYDCTAEGCGAVQYRLLFTPDPRLTVGFANEWNRTRRYGKSYIERDGSLLLEWDVDLDGGISTTALNASIRTFEQLVVNFDAQLAQALRAPGAGDGKRPPRTVSSQRGA